MFILFETVNQNLILGFIPESLGVLISGIGLFLLAVGLRTILKRSEENAKRDMTHITQ